ncbi:MULTISPECIES: type II toxin-antitoxin system HicA family toxin [Hymenobacter]|uniref:Addiction module toxin, HicA family n=2 Tax=Hymenobacter TaxID=89966 RepID=A0A4Z0PMU3_9BACT|nr:type II toxin-antitoxin system HicA family toxin [Hymenobacter elongatus]TGE17803.1 addiction module toxin, HicA family [Hymenobacter elongatus]
MTIKTLRNVTIRDYRTFLERVGCQCTRTKGGHEHWTRKDLNRPVTFQTHIDPVPEFILKNGLRILGLGKEDFWAELEK